jgi:ribosomal protein L11
MIVNQANFVNAKTSTFEYFQVPVTLTSVNDAEFELAA